MKNKNHRNRDWHQVEEWGGEAERKREKQQQWEEKRVKEEETSWLECLRKNERGEKKRNKVMREERYKRIKN